MSATFLGVVHAGDLVELHDADETIMGRYREVGPARRPLIEVLRRRHRCSPAWRPIPDGAVVHHVFLRGCPQDCPRRQP